MGTPLTNSREWWETYFVHDWDAHGGGAQTRYFMEQMVANLPPTELTFLQSRPLRILDWGCAFGEGVVVLANAFPMAQLVGLDFAERAIQQARIRHPGHPYIHESSGKIPGTFDVIVTSNCLEHFDDPGEVIERHLPHCSSLYIALVPDDEWPLHFTHRSRLLASSFPESLCGFTRVCTASIELDPHYWPGSQLLVIYGSPRYVSTCTPQGIRES